MTDSAEPTFTQEELAQLENEAWDYCDLCMCPVIVCSKCKNASCNCGSCEECYPKFNIVWHMQNWEASRRPHWYNRLRDAMENVYKKMETPTTSPFDEYLDPQLEPKIIKEKLLSEARAVAQNAYCPFSKFQVGAAVLATKAPGVWKIFTGCNVENASYGLSICAERAAICKAISEGYRELLQVTVACINSSPEKGVENKTPCGACRQFILEFGDGRGRPLVNIDGVGTYAIEELLYMGFKI